MPDTTGTAKQAAFALDCNIAQIVKSLIFKTKRTNQSILIMVSGINNVNEKIIENYVGEEIIKADAAFTKKVTGFSIGGVPPIGHACIINHIFFDQDLLNFETVWTAAGTSHAVMNMKTKDLIQMTQSKIILIK